VPAPSQGCGIEGTQTGPPGQHVLGRYQAAVVELQCEAGAMGVHRIGYGLEARNEAVVRDGDLPRLVAADRPGHAGNPDIDQGRSTLGLLFEIETHPLAAVTIFRQVHTHRGHQDAVLQLHPADAAGRQQVGESVGAHGGSPDSSCRFVPSAGRNELTLTVRGPSFEQGRRIQECRHRSF
jgi:hypothetical protein